MKRIQYMPVNYQERLIGLMDERNINAIQLAAQLKLSRNTVYDWINDSRIMSTVNFMELCEFFDVNPLWLYGLSNERGCFNG